MTVRNTATEYGSIAKWLHWIVAILIICMLILGTVMTELDKTNPIRLTLYMIHKSTGATILALFIIRIIWRWTNPTPALPSEIPAWQQRSAKWMHILFYILIIVMLLSGMIMSTAGNHPIPFWGLFTFKIPFVPHSKTVGHFFGNVHQTLAWAIAVLLVLHIGVVFKHHCKDKIKIMHRMMPKKRCH